MLIETKWIDINLAFKLNNCGSLMADGGGNSNCKSKLYITLLH